MSLLFMNRVALGEKIQMIAQRSREDIPHSASSRTSSIGQIGKWGHHLRPDSDFSAENFLGIDFSGVLRVLAVSLF